jgi:chlorobactene glucosyltransferase
MVTLYQLLIFVVLVLVLLNTLANLFTFEGLRPVAPPSGGPLVSVLVPARNEIRNVEDCIRSLLLQDYPHYELIVLDDASTDGTGELVARLIAQVRNPRVTARMLRGEPLPDGWVGKNWACHQLAAAAAGEYLLFTDADTIHAPGFVSAAMDYSKRHRASLVSAWPRLLTGSLGEKLVVPGIVLMGLGFCPLWLQRMVQNGRQKLSPNQARGLGVANGQMLLFTREAYDHIGGHAAHRNHLVEDVNFGREIAARMGEGMRLFNCEALQFSTVRMYRSFAETWEGFTKNMWAVFDGQRLAFWTFGTFQWFGLLGPFLWLLAYPGPERELAFGELPGPAPLLSLYAWKVVVAQVIILYLIRIVLAFRFRTSWIGALLHPFAIILMGLIGLNSWRKSMGAGVVWKGRTYRPDL